MLNSLSQSLTVLPAPSGREPLARPQTSHFSRKLCRYAKGPILEGAVERSETGEVCSRRAREQQLFPVWKTACFPAFSTQKNGSGPVLKTCDRFIPDWRKINRRSGTVCRMQRKSFDFLFYKRQNARIFAQNLPESCGLNYGVYRADTLLLWKTRWKKWKTSWKTCPFLHKNGGKPGEKSEKFIPDRKLHTLSGCAFVP